MARQQGDRRLEVIVLAGRGLSESVSVAGRRKVQFTLVSAQDKEGDAFGAKVSPWTEPKGAAAGRWVRFGSSSARGLQASFPLTVGRGAPPVAANVRFVESAELQVRLLASMVPSKSAAMKTAAQWVPGAGAFLGELDEATAQLEAEVRVPLTNILSGRVGFAADRALGGWVPLRLCRAAEDDAARGAAAAGPPGAAAEAPALWMQLYVLPDHQAMLPALSAQLEQEIAKISEGSRPKAEDPNATPPAQDPAAPLRRLAEASAASPAPKWGPPGAPTRRHPEAQTVGDLIDVTLDESPATNDNLLDMLNGGQGAAGLPRLGGSLPVVGVPASVAAASGTPAGPGEGDGNGASAFGFIANTSPGATLDLAALYGDPGGGSSAARAAQGQGGGGGPGQDPFKGLPTERGGGGAAGAALPAGAGTGSLESMEQQLLKDLGGLKF